MRPFKFLHMADVHLGIEQYNSQERFRDFNRSFHEVLMKAVEARVDFVLIAGDLFEKSTVTPATLTALHAIIMEFRDASKKEGLDIPIIAIQGNHDAGYTYGARRSWMDFLAELGLIKLLDMHREGPDSPIDFHPFSSRTNKGGYIDIKDARIYGIRHLGTNTPKFFPLVHDAIPARDDKVNILMMHFGIEGQEKEEFGIDINDTGLKSLREKVDYLAVGHFHKMYILPTSDPWIYNPGSTEVTSGKEIFEREVSEGYERGVFIVEYLDKHVRNVTKVTFSNGTTWAKNQLPNRRFLPVRVNLDRPDLTTFPKTVDHILSEPLIAQLKRPAGLDAVDATDLNVPVLFVLLDGKLQYSMMEFNSRLVQDRLEKELDIVTARVYSRATSKLDDISIENDDDKAVAVIEKETFMGLAASNEAYKNEKESIAAFMMEMKNALTSTEREADTLKMQVQQFYITHVKGGSITDVPAVATPSKPAAKPPVEVLHEDPKPAEKQSRVEAILDDFDEAYEDGTSHKED